MALARRPIRVCRNCKQVAAYPRYYPAHLFQCPTCRWREFIDFRKQLRSPGQDPPPIVRLRPLHIDPYPIV